MRRGSKYLADRFKRSVETVYPTHNKIMKKIILIKIVIYAICISAICFIIWVCRFSVLAKIDEILSLNKISEINLTEQQKLEDFNYVYNSIVESTLSLEDFNELYEIDFAAKKSEYEEIIKNTSDNFEFFVAMKAIIRDIPGFHSDMVYPDINAYSSLNCYNSRAVCARLGIRSYTEYWNNLVDEKSSAFINQNEVSFIYVSGEYVYNIFNCNNPEYEDSILLSVNGGDTEEYISQNISTKKLHYDFVRGIVYRDIIVFNDTAGEPVSAEIRLKDGTVVTKQLFSDIYGSYYIDIRKPSAGGSVYFYEDGGISYLKIDDLSAESCKRAGNFLKTSNNSNIILDIRDNYGGMIDNAGKYILPYLYVSHNEYRNVWYIKDTKQNMKMYDSLYMLLNIRLIGTKGTEHKYSERNDVLYSELAFDFAGKSGHDKNVYVLTSNATGSSADTLAAFLKSNGLAQIIGDNTGGEGLTYSFMAESLPNSKLVFIYTPGKAFNSDGTVNSVYGTSPDIYTEQSYDGYKIFNDLDDPYTYENRLKWDNVLIKTIEIIKEKENTK